jgi:hypothetical protein
MRILKHTNEANRKKFLSAAADRKSFKSVLTFWAKAKRTIENIIHHDKKCGNYLTLHFRDCVKKI